MSESLSFPSLPLIKKIENLRNNRLLVLAASNFDMELLPTLYSQLEEIGKVEKLDVLLHSRGGVINAARRIALLLRKYAKEVTFIVPYYCESAGTILALSGDEIIAGNMAIFTPIDPHFHGGSEEQSTALSCLDIKQFGQMCKDWFGVDPEQANAEQVSLLCNSIFPPTLTAFYRAANEAQQITEELLAYQLNDVSREKRTQIVKHLMYNYQSHHYAITPEEMYALGIKCHKDSEILDLAWEVSKDIQKIVGGGVRSSLEKSWNDALILSKESGYIRLNPNNGLQPKWSPICTYA